MTPATRSETAGGVAVSRFPARNAVGRGNALLVATGGFLLLCLIPTAVAWALDDRLFNGVSVWIKPMKFQASLAVHLLSVAALMLFLPQTLRRGRQLRWLSLAMVVAAVFEAGYIAWQAGRAQASHYSVETPFTVLMYQLMGAGAVTLVAAGAWVGVLVLRHGRGPAVLVAGAGLGLVLGGVLGGITGGWMSAQPGHWVGGVASDAGGLPVVGWVRDGGDLRVAHFFGLHMTQALPALALALWALHRRRWRAPLYAGAALGTAMTLGTFVQAMMGRPFW